MAFVIIDLLDKEAPKLELLEQALGAAFTVAEEIGVAVAVVVGHRDGDTTVYGMCCHTHARDLLAAGLKNPSTKGLEASVVLEN